MMIIRNISIVALNVFIYSIIRYVWNGLATFFNGAHNVSNVADTIIAIVLTVMIYLYWQEKWVVNVEIVPRHSERSKEEKNKRED